MARRVARRVRTEGMILLPLVPEYWNL
ncbi:hypothetical protein CCACVL1_25571 [Corchorus capsularis]|uniref:Uncharacterized protein n=1 Tax=Corchorus capsularis TaxID=210143 RepID=A0A1R3GJ91_COCAP|nr:hypothetical protein CCACVL1_25571 [Corchorus capsularis]